MAKNGRQKLWAVKWKMFPKKGHPRKIFGCEILFRPPNSARSLRQWEDSRFHFPPQLCFCIHQLMAIISKQAVKWSPLESHSRQKFICSYVSIIIAVVIFIHIRKSKAEFTIPFCKVATCRLGNNVQTPRTKMSSDLARDRV